MSTRTPRKNKIYHIYNRGNHREMLGHDKEDYDFLYGLIKSSFDVRNYELMCFCVMPTHYHILATQTGKRPLSFAMHNIDSKYTTYYNQKYGESGHVFQGVYKRKWIIGTWSFLIVYAYILNNPNKIRNPTFQISPYPWLYDNRFLVKNYLARKRIEYS